VAAHSLSNHLDGLVDARVVDWAAREMIVHVVRFSEEES